MVGVHGVDDRLVRWIWGKFNGDFSRHARSAKPASRCCRSIVSFTILISAGSDGEEREIEEEVRSRSHGEEEGIYVSNVKYMTCVNNAHKYLSIEKNITYRVLLVSEYYEDIYEVSNKYRDCSQIVLFQEPHLDRTSTSVILIGTSILVQLHKRGLK